LLDVAEFNALPGRGVQGQINGATYHLGNHRMLEELGQCTPELEQRIAALETAGKTVVMLVGAKAVHALFAVADTIKDSSRRAIAELHALGINTMMLTGDNPHTAQAIAAQAGIDSAQGNLLPDDKLREVEQLARSGKVGMVGDGINDAPALARADIGFAMGAAGTDTAIETADVALMDDNLRKIPTFVRVNKSFIVLRALTMRQMLEASARMSRYMHYTISEKKQSIWIAQREGRAKDSNDRTQDSVLKMLAIGGEGDVIDRLMEMNIAPLAISYEYDPCDFLKAQEFQLKRDIEGYKKTTADDLLNMQTGLFGYKGRVHFQTGACMNDELAKIDRSLPKPELFARMSARRRTQKRN
jgi:soluble P-type ATPase